MDEKQFSFFKKPPDKNQQTEIIAHLAEQYPCLVQGEIGKSMLGEGLRFFRFGTGRRAVLYVGAHHAMEWITALLLYRFVDDVAEAEKRNGWTLWKNVSLYVVPLLNPDGVEINLHGAAAGGPLADRLRRQNGGSEDFSHWQANARGVDLNHNYDAGFADYRKIERDAGLVGGAPTRYSGEYPLSEPETAALSAFLAMLHPAVTLTLHTQGEEIYYHSTLPPIPGADEIGVRLSRLTGYRIGRPEGAAAYGGMSDYAAEVLRLRAYTLECGLGQNPLPIEQGRAIYRRLRRALFAIPMLL